MRKSLTVLLLLCIVTLVFPQQNTQLLGQLNPRTGGYSSLWGYTAPDGKEYAILGCNTGTSIINVTNPLSPVEVAFITGPTSGWREMKTWGTYAYVVSEGSGTLAGMQIINLANLPVSANLVTTYTTTFTRAHDIFTADGYAYVCGTSNDNGGIHILNLANPTAPVQSGYWSQAGYVHDMYVYLDTIYASCGNSQNWQLVNATNKANPVRISTSATLPGIYAHSGWLTQDKRYFVTCEEFNVRDLCVWDLQDRTSWNLVVSQWQLPGTNYIHNIYIKGKYAHIAHYKEGYVVLDLTDPANPVKVGQYDTYPGTNGGYNGAWNCYPFLPSGNVIVSDMTTGLYVIKFLLDSVTPVELTSFTADIVNKSVMLKWITSTEKNNRGFEVQKSANGNNWLTTAFVKGAGTSAIIIIIHLKIMNHITVNLITGLYNLILTAQAKH